MLYLLLGVLLGYWITTRLTHYGCQSRQPWMFYLSSAWSWVKQWFVPPTT